MKTRRIVLFPSNVGVNRSLFSAILCSMKRLAFLGLLVYVATAARASAASDDVGAEIARSAAALLEADYVYPDRGAQAAQVLRRNADAGTYDGLHADALATRITADLTALLHDKHVRVLYAIQPRTMQGPVTAPAPPDRDVNDGLGRIAHLPGNVGYVDLRSFERASDDSARALDAAMDSVAASDTIVLDLRHNRGGDPESVARVLSHVLPPNTHLEDFVGRDGEIEASSSTVALSTPAIRAPLYVLTSPETFSGGEECAYDLQALQRATLVGATTGGGANPGRVMPIDAQFSIFVPGGRPMNAITQTNWEGVGVKPDVAVPADQALVKAYELILDRKLNDATLSAGRRAELRALRSRLNAMTDPAILSL